MLVCLSDCALLGGAEMQEVEAAAALVAAVREDAGEQEEQCSLNGSAV